MQPDHLGSSSTLTNSSGAVVSRERYSAFGERRRTSDKVITDQLYTGQRLNVLSNLYHYSDGGSAGRFYDPLLGRFVQADSVTPPGSQGLNRYSYALNSPVRYNDPDGHCPVCIIAGLAVLKAIDYGWTAYDAWQAARTLSDPAASQEEKLQAAADLAMTAAFEAAEPDDLIPLGLPIDDLARKGILKGMQLPLPGLDKVARQGGDFIKGLDTVVHGQKVRRVASALTNTQKDKLRAEAVSLYDVVNPGRRQAEALQVHHRIPLEWAHLFPDADPNRLANLVGLPASVHHQVTARWNSWRNQLGRVPTAAEVMDFARQIDDEFGTAFR